MYGIVKMKAGTIYKSCLDGTVLFICVNFSSRKPKKLIKWNKNQFLVH